MVITIVVGVVSLAIGGFASYFITGKMLEKKLGNAKNVAEKTLKDVPDKIFSIFKTRLS